MSECLTQERNGKMYFIWQVSIGGESGGGSLWSGILKNEGSARQTCRDISKEKQNLKEKISTEKVSFKSINL